MYEIREMWERYENMSKLIGVSNRDHQKLKALSSETGKTVKRLVHEAVTALYFEKEGQGNGGQAN